MESELYNKIRLKIADYVIDISGSTVPFFLKSTHLDFKYEGEDKATIQVEVEAGDLDKYMGKPAIFRVENNSKLLWTVHNHNGGYQVITGHEDDGIFPYRIAFCDKEFRKWRIVIPEEQVGKPLSLLEYPLDALLLYYLATFNNGCLIHAAGVNNDGIGMVFTGVSGRGKSTTSKLWYNYGAKIVNDDRLLIRELDGKYYLHNTPMLYYNQKPKKAELKKIFLIDHAPENKAVPVKGTDALMRVMANCIQHGYNKENISRLIEFMTKLVNSVPVYHLGFLPDNSVIDYVNGLIKK